MVDEGELVAQAAGDRKGRVDARRGQPALSRHLAESRRLARQTALRKTLLRARRDGEPSQRVSGRSVRRPHLDGDDARQPAAALVRLDGLCALVRPAPHRPGPYTVRQRDLRYDPPETVEARRARQNQRTPRQDRLRIRLPERPGEATGGGKTR